MHKYNRIMSRIPFFYQDRVGTAVSWLQRAVSGELLVGREVNVGMSMMMVFQKDTRGEVLSFAAGMSRGCKGKVEIETVIDFVESDYVIGGFVRKLGDYVEEQRII